MKKAISSYYSPNYREIPIPKDGKMVKEVVKKKDPLEELKE